MNYLLDTNILLHILRKSPLKEILEHDYDFESEENNIFISVVTVGELYAIAIRNSWGEHRIKILKKIIKEYIIADIHSEDVLESYAQIDAFSQGKLPGKPLVLSARNMSKNDLWIAATASVLNATLITTDTDFDHLADNFLKLIRTTA